MSSPTALRTTPVGIGAALVSAAGEVIAADPFFAQLAGREVEEAIGLRFPDFVRPDEEDSHDEELRKLLAGELDGYALRRRIVQPDGGTRPARVRISRAPGDGQHPGFFVLTQELEESGTSADQEIQSTEDPYQSLVEVIPYGVADLDASGCFVETNEALHAMLECTADELRGRPWWEFLSYESEREDRRREHPALTAKRPPPLPYVSRFRRTNGEEIDVRIDWNYRARSDEEVIGFLGVISNLSEIRRDAKRTVELLERVRDESEMLKAVLRQIPFAIAIAEVGSEKILLSNERFSRICGHDGDLVDDGSCLPECLQLVDERPAEETWPLARALRKGEVILDEEHRVRLANDAVRTLQVSAGPIRDEFGGITAAVTVIDDITGRLEAQAQQRQLVRAVESAAEAVVLADRSGCIRQVNPAFTRITGYSAEEALGQNPCILKSGLQEQSFYDGMWERITAGEVWTGRVINRRKDGSHYHAELTIAPISEEDGSVSGYVGVQRDVTQRVEYEEQLKRSKAEAEDALAQLEQAHAQLLQADKMASIGQLAAGVAHEINNPIGFIASNVNTLGEYGQDIKRLFEALPGLCEACRASGDAGVQEALSAFEQATADVELEFILEDLPSLIEESMEGTERVKKIVGDLRDFSHVDSPDVAEEDLNELIEKTINVAWNALKYKAEVVRGYGEIPAIPCQGGKLGQVFLNLIINAAHAIEEKGTVNIRTGLAGDRVFVEVADTGCGMSEEVLSHIYEPFFTTKEVGEGTGMGLNLAYKIIETHGGTIHVQSEVGVGTTFRVELPVEGAPQVFAECADSTTPDTDAAQEGATHAAG